MLKMRLDMTREVLATGILMKEEEDNDEAQTKAESSSWVIRWQYGTKIVTWRRSPEDVEEDPLKDDSDASMDEMQLEAKKSAMKKIKDWEALCPGSAPITWGIYLGFGAGAGLSFLASGSIAGGGIYAEVMPCVLPAFVEQHADQLECMVNKFGTFMGDKEPEVRNASFFQNVVQILRPPEASMKGCVPGLCLTFDFTVLPIPSPVPMISFQMFWAGLLPHEIKDCYKTAGLHEIINSAMLARPAVDDPNVEDAQQQMDKITDRAQEDRAIGMNAYTNQGISFGLFPVPMTVGWFVMVDLELTINTRILMQGWRRNQDAILNFRKRGRCEDDRYEFFLSTRNWAKAAHTLMESNSEGCIAIKDRIRKIGEKENMRGIKFQSDPFAYISSLPELMAESPDQTSSLYLGGGYVYIGSDGVTTGYYNEAANPFKSPERYSNPECTEYAAFVNTYRSRVAPARHRVLDIKRHANDQDFCQIGKLPNLAYNSCTAQKSCEACSQTLSYGFPCTYCPTYQFSKCVQAFSTFDTPCFGGTKIRKRYDDFDKENFLTC